MQWFGPRMAGWYRKGSVPKREERREKREERREKREEIPKKAARDPQMRPREVPNEVPRGLWASWRPDRVRGRDGEATGRPPKKTNELPRVCFPKILKISGCYEDGRQLESLHFYRVPWPPRLEAKRAQKKSF